MDNQNKTIFITGASSGIGRDIAYSLAKLGYKVFAGVRRKVDKQELESLNQNIVGVYIDVTNQASIEKAFWFVMKNANKVDVLINNAGIVCAGPVACIPISKVKEQFDVNTFGPIMVTQRFIPLLHGSKVINISSMAASGIFPYISMYCASKRALDIIFSSFFLENKDNIKVISVKPSSIKTPIWKKSAIKAKETLADFSDVNKQKYEEVMLALEKNAINNSIYGIEPRKVTDIIIKIIKSKHPKISYDVGVQAHVASFFSKLPQCIVNAIVKLKLRNLM